MARSKPLDPWTVITTETAFRTPWFRITKQALRTPGRVDVTYYTHHADDGVLCVCVRDDNAILIERQYRHPVAKVSTDYPAGKMEATDPSSTAAVLRELREETGFEAQKIEQLAALDRDPGFSTTRMHIFLARGNVTQAPAPEATEDIAATFVPPAEILRLIQSGEMGCTFCVSATLLAFTRLNWLQPALP